MGIDPDMAEQVIMDPRFADSIAQYEKMQQAQEQQHAQARRPPPWCRASPQPPRRSSVARGPLPQPHCHAPLGTDAIAPPASPLFQLMPGCLCPHGLTRSGTQRVPGPQAQQAAEQPDPAQLMAAAALTAGPACSEPPARDAQGSR